MLVQTQSLHFEENLCLLPIFFLTGAVCGQNLSQIEINGKATFYQSIAQRGGEDE